MQFFNDIISILQYSFPIKPSYHNFLLTSCVTQSITLCPSGLLSSFRTLPEKHPALLCLSPSRAVNNFPFFYRPLPSRLCLSLSYSRSTTFSLSIPLGPFRAFWHAYHLKCPVSSQIQSQIKK